MVGRIRVALVAAACVSSGFACLHAVAAGATTSAVVNVADLSVVEGDAGKATVKIPVDLSVPETATVTVPYAVVPSPDGTGDAADVVLKHGKLTFLPGVASKTVDVAIVGDTIPEPDQHFLVKLGTPVGAATLGKATGDLVVQDDDHASLASARLPAPDTIQLTDTSPVEASIGSVRVEEADAGLHKAYLPVTLNVPAPTKMVVTFQLDCTTAQLISDVGLRQTGRLVFLAGQRVLEIPFTITPNTTPEQIKTLTEQIAASFGPLQVLQANGEATIVDNDGQANGFGRVLPSFSPSPLPGASDFDGGTVGASENVSVASDGTPAQYPTVPPNESSPKLSHRPAINHDGRYVAFESDGTNLVPGDTNGMGDIFVHDRQTGATERVDANSDGSQVTTDEMSSLQDFGVSIWAPAISADGRFVAFTTAAPLVPSDTFGSSWVEKQDVYVFDRATHTTELVSAMPDGSAAGGASFSPSISADGRYIAFSAQANSTRLPLGSLAAGQYDHRIYVRDRLMGTTNLVFDGEGWAPSISADGTTVVFGTSVGVCPVGPQLLALNLSTGASDRIDVTTDGSPAFEDAFSEQYFNPAVSADGRYVTFKAWAWNLIPGMTGPTAYGGAIPIGLVHAFVRDRVAGTTKMLPPIVEYDDPPSISDDGAKVAAGIAVAGSYAGLGVIDVASGASTPYGYGGQAVDDHPISGDGRYVAYTRDNWPYGDVYVARIP